jgi:hypothetical protein
MKNNFENMPEINRRVRQVVDYYADGVVTKFAESIEIQQQTLNRLFVIDKRTGKFPLATTEILQKISEKYDCVDVNWLLNGQGKMLLNGEKSVHNFQHARIRGGDNSIIGSSIEGGNNSNSDIFTMLNALLAEKNERIKEKDERIEELKQTIADLRSK